MKTRKLEQLVKIRGVAFITLVIFVLGSCQKDGFNPELSKGLQGKWVEKNTSDNIFIYKKVSSFEANSSGIEFKTNGIFVNKSDKVWVGVPLPTYYSFDGLWKKMSESKYLISTTLQGIEKSFQMEVISLNDNELKAKFVFSNLLKGIWIYQSEYDGVVTYKLSDSFDNDLPGIEFKDEGVFIERANSGFCGTPPISYTNYEGTWNEISENFYEIEVPYWGGSQNYTIEMVSLIDTELKIKFIYPEVE